MTTTKRTKRGTVAALLILAALLIAAALTTTADSVQRSIWSLLPPFVAISLALVTKEVYSALFAGIVSGGLLYSGFALEGTINHVYSEGIVAVLSDGAEQYAAMPGAAYQRLHADVETYLYTPGGEFSRIDMTWAHQALELLHEMG